MTFLPARALRACGVAAGLALPPPHSQPRTGGETLPGICLGRHALLPFRHLGERTLALAQQFGLTPGRISQKRRQYHGDWERFCGDLPPGQPTQPAPDAG